MPQQITRRFVDTRSGRVHLAECGVGSPLLLLHQTPRSWDEYRDVLPLVGRKYRALAMDTRGFGDSDPLAKTDITIEDWAAAALDLADALGLPTFAVGGHHTGAVIALELASRAPERITHLIVSAMPFVDAERRARHAGHRVIDDVTARPDGQHLAELWERRRPYYPEQGSIDLLERFVRDALKAGPMMVEGHRVVNRYRMEDRIGLVRCPTLILAPTDDPHTFPIAHRVRDAIAGAELQEVPGGMVPFPDQMPHAFADAVCGFLDRRGFSL